MPVQGGLADPGPARHLPRPASWLGTSGGACRIDVALTATAYDVPAGHSLTLVVDTVDPLYYDENATGGSVTIAGGSYVDIPLR
jgi:hypothetical protein